MSERKELVQIIIDITELRNKSSYKKTYDIVLKYLTRKLSRSKYAEYKVDNSSANEQISIQLQAESSLS